MSKDKAIVLEKTDGFYLILDSNGAFRRVRSRFKAEVGEEIEVVSDVSDKKKRALKAILSVAALFLLTMLSTLWFSWQTPVAVAMLSVDINPSLEIALDKGAHIVSTKAKNDDAVQLLEGVNLKGETLTVAMNRLVTRAVELNFLNTENKWIVVGFSERTEGKASKQSDLAEVDAQASLSRLNEAATSKDLGLQVVMFKLTSQEVLEAQKADLSLGEYALWQTAEKAGLSVQPQTLKNTADRSHLLEAPAVQDTLKHNRNMVDLGSSEERPNQEIKTAPDHERNGVKDKLPSEKNSREQNSSDVKPNTDSDHEEKSGTASVKSKDNNLGKDDNLGQEKRGPAAEEKHGSSSNNRGEGSIKGDKLTELNERSLSRNEKE